MEKYRNHHQKITFMECNAMNQNPEQKARDRIDELLQLAGWSV
jgi:type I site-specific restriction endonuclease